jgi:hypothetical protein
MSLQKKDNGMTYAPKTPDGKLKPVCGPGEFPLA